MYIYSYNSLATTRTIERAEEWLTSNPRYYQVGVQPFIAFSLESAFHQMSVAKNFHPGPVFVIRALLTRGAREQLFRGSKIHGDMAYIATLDVMRSVRLNKEFPI